MQEININLNDLICDVFIEVFEEIVNCRYGRIVLNGGRASTKSQTAATAIVVGVMESCESAVALVKYQNKIQDRLVNTFTSAINYLGVQDQWKLRRSPFEYVLLDDNGKETSVSIKFSGADDPENLKSFRSRSGGSFRYIWFEELTNFNSLSEVDDIILTLSRMEGTVIMTYNPPESSSNWVNKAFNCPTGAILDEDGRWFVEEFTFRILNEEVTVRQKVHHSTYLDVIASGHADWLNINFIGEAEKAKENNERYYKWKFLGLVVGTDANVFYNVKDWDGDVSKINARLIYRGLDWGLGGKDPTRFVSVYYDRLAHSLYALDEFGKPRSDWADIAMHLRETNQIAFPINAESATPIMNTQLRKEGVIVIPVSKKPDSVRGGIMWLRSLNAIYICKTKTPMTYKEFTEYEYKITRDGEITAELVDKDNHSIDAVRYACVDVIKY